MRTWWKSLPVRHRIGVLVTFGFALWFAARGVDKALRPEGNDFTVYWRSGAAVLRGENPNRVEKHIYPPFFALVMAPWALLPHGVAAVLWQALSVAALVWIVRETVVFLVGDPSRAPPWLWWAPAACVLRLADSNFANGQVNLLTLALVFLGLRAWREGRDVRAGVWIAAGAASKVLPGIFGLYFLVRRSWRAAASTLVATAVLVFVVPSALLGWGRNLDYLVEWWEAFPAHYVRGGSALLDARPYLPGQSLTAVFYRLLCDTPATSAGGGGANVLAWDPDLVEWIVRGAIVGLYAVLVLLVWRRAPRREAGGTREVALVLSTALLTAPQVHKSHMVWAILSYGVVVHHLFGGDPLPCRWPHFVLFVLSVLFVSGSAPGLVGRPLATGLLSHNVVFFGLVALYGSLVTMHVGLGSEEAGRGG